MTHPKRTFNIFNSLERAITHHWSIVLSSDGYANYGTDDQLTNDGYGASGFGNPGAWCVLSKTINNQQYQFCLQTDGYMGFRLKYSKVGFNSGTGDLVRVPSAIDQQVLLGGGGDVTPTYQQVIGGSFNFNINSVIISLTTATNILNFTLQPIIPTTLVKPPPQKPIINKILT